jgi:hypothetical protein
VRLADHAEQGFVFRFAVDHPGGVEDLVAAVLGVGLREHHQFNVGRIAPGLRENVEQVIDFVVGERQTERAIGLDQAFFPPFNTSTVASGFGAKWRNSSPAASKPGSTESVIRSCSRPATVFFSPAVSARFA